MTVTADREIGWDELLRAWLEIDAPKNWRAEIIDGEIVMTPPPAGPHHTTVGLLTEMLVPAKPSGCGVFHTLGVVIPTSLGGYIPDLCVVPYDRLPESPDGAGYVPADAVLLAVEVTSKRNADHDRKAKKWGYAHGGVPLYLLVDRFDDDGPVISLFSSPIDGAYQETITVRFGKPINLPAPFDLEIPTDSF